MWSPPPAAERAERPKVRVVQAALVVVAMALAGAVAGVIGAYALANRSHPTDADVRAAARSLVPPGATIIEQGAGRAGGNPFDPGPYSASFHATVGEEDFEKRRNIFHGLARSSGWKFIRISSSGPGGESTQFEKPGLLLRIRVSKVPESHGGDATVSVRRPEGARPPHTGLGAALGTGSGIVSAGMVIALVRQRRTTAQ